METTSAEYSLSKLEFQTSDDYSYVTPEGVEFIPCTARNATGTYFGVPTSTSIKVTDFLVAKQAGKVFAGYSAQPATNYSDGTYTSPSTKEEVTLTPIFTENIGHTITVTEDSKSNGTVTIEPSGSVAADVTVTITVKPNEGYEVDNVVVTTGESDNVSVSSVAGKTNQWSFVMPNGEVTVEVKYKALLKVEIADTENGTVTANPKYAKTGDTITVSAFPRQHYELISISATSGDTPVELIAKDAAHWTFTMPGGNVTVSAAFRETEFITNVRLGTLYDGPGLNSIAYTGKYKYEASNADSENRMVGEYTLSKPTSEENDAIGTYLRYTLNASNLRMFAHVRPTAQTPNPVTSNFGYYLGLIFEPKDWASYNFSVKLKTRNEDGSFKDAVISSEDNVPATRYSTTSTDSDLTLYFPVDSESDNSEFWFEVSWTVNSITTTEWICVELTGNLHPITHTYKAPETQENGFVGGDTSKTSYGETNDSGAQIGFEAVADPQDLGWTIPNGWTWHWVVDGKATLNPGDNLTSLKGEDVEELSPEEETSGIGEDYGHIISYYDHEFVLVFDNIPKHTVTATQSENGKIELTPEPKEGKYNLGETVTVTATPNKGFDISKLTVGGENVTTRVYNGTYSFVVTGDTEVTAEFITADTAVTGVTVNGLTASHSGDKEWTIVLPWNSTLPDVETGTGIRFNLSGGGTPALEKVETDGTKAASYIYKIGESQYTVKVSIAERRDFDLTVQITNGSFKADAGVNVQGDKTTVAENTKIELTLISGFAYALPDNITVTVGNVTLSSKDYTYNKNTGKLIIQSTNVTGNVVIKGNCKYGSVHIDVLAGHEDVYMVYYDVATNKNTEIHNPTHSSDLPRTGDGENEIVQTAVLAKQYMAPTSSQSSSSGQSGNAYQWIIPDWLVFDGWYVNEDENGNHTDNKDDYTLLTAADGSGAFLYTPKASNPNPVIEARWTEKETYTLTVTLMPGADDVVYDGPVDDPPPAELWHTLVIDNPMTVTAKAVLGDTIHLYIPETYYTRDNYHFNQWVDELGEPIKLDSNGAIEATYDPDTGDKDLEMVVYAQWAKDSTDYEITVTFEPGEHGSGKTFVTTFNYNIDVGGTMSPQSFRIPTPDDCKFEIEEGWEFTGWIIDGDSSGTTYKDSTSSREFIDVYSEGATFIAQWKQIPLVDIHYTVSPGSGNEVTGGDSAQVLSKDSQVRTVTLPTTIEGIKAKFTGWIIPEGVEFLNWTFGDGRIVNEEAGAGQTEAFRPTEGMTITATWTTKDKVDTWQLEFDANGGDEADENDMPALIHRVEKDNENAEWTVEVGECNFEAPEGMQFSYWTINGKQVSPNSIYTIKQSDIRDGKITVKAVWKNIPDTVVKVYFRGGGGTGSMSSDEVKIAWNETSKTYTFPSCDYVGTSVNPTFAGWKYTVKGARDGKPFSESDGKIYQPGTVITVKAPSSNETITSIELVAQWKPQSSGTGGGGSGFGGGTGAGAGTGAGTGTGTGTGTSTGSNPVITPEPSEQPSNGKVDSNVHSANTGDTVTVLPTPDSRYMTSKVVVKDKDGNEVDVTWNGDGTYSFEMPEGGVTVTAEFVTPDEVYEDVEAGDWYLADVANAANYGLMTGVSATDFGPDETATRAQMMTILARRNNVPGTWAGGADWYKAGAEWAVNEGISDGTRLFDALTREEIITMLYRYVGSPKVSGSRTAAFADANTVDSWAVDAIEWAVEVGIMQGRGNNELAPRDVATRAELAAILSRVMRLVKEF